MPLGRVPWHTAMQFCTPVKPIRYSGDAMVVSCGTTISSKMMLSNPTTLTSRGTDTPSLRRPFMMPMASGSLYASTAVASSSATRRAAVSPASTVGSFGPMRRASSSSSAAASRNARQRTPSDQLVSGPATYKICPWPSAPRCSAARRIPRSLSFTTQLASGMIRFSSTTGVCLAIIRSAESLIRELAMTKPSTCPSSRSMVCRSTSGDSLVCKRTS